MGGYIYASLEFIVNGETALIMNVINADAMVSASLANFTLLVKILSVHIDDLVVI